MKKTLTGTTSLEKITSEQASHTPLPTFEENVQTQLKQILLTEKEERICVMATD